MERGETIFSDFLHELEVPHTVAASDAAFRGMNFKSLFGFSRLLESYNIESRGIKVSDKKVLTSIPAPFIAQCKDGFVIVTGFEGSQGNDENVEYIKFNRKHTDGLADFEDKWSGVALLAYPSAESCEPDYKRHRFFDLASSAKKWLLVLCVLFVGIYGFVNARLWHSLPTVLLTLVDLAGIGVTWLLVLKTLKVTSKSADKICSVLQEHGCDHVLEQKASKFFGLFGWSEVGIAYFSVSTVILFLFPSLINYLALINAVCLPFTVWSIWYQKFRIKTWCTLCVTTQCLLWLQFLCYLFAGSWHDIFPLRMPLFVMGAAYVAVLLGVNRVNEFIEKRTNK